MPLDEHSNSKGKAVVKEEVFPLPPVEQKPFAFMISNINKQDDKSKVKKEAEAVSHSLRILQETAAPPGYHQIGTPPSNNNNNTVTGSSDGNNNNNDVLLHGGSSSSSVVQQDQYYDVGSSSTTSAAQLMQLSALQWGAISVPTALTTTILPAFVDTSRRVHLKDTLQHCVAALAAADVVAADAALVAMSSLASHDGDPLQRVAYAFAEALGRRALQLLPGVSRGLLQHLELPALRPPSGGCTGASRHRFDAVCPLLRAAASVANHAIVTAMEGEEHVHVVDLGGASPNQWLDLLRLFAAERPPCSLSLRLTVVGEDQGLLAAAAWVLHQEAARLHIPFVFNPVRSHIDRLSPGDVFASMGAHPHEALAITSTLQLHRLIADTIELPNAAADRQRAKKAKHHQNQNQSQSQSQEITRADVLLRVLQGLSPKLVVLTEQEAYHNGATLGERVGNAFDYYAALFEDLQVACGGGSAADRAAVERTVLREEIMDVVARDGAARRERHEGVMRWAQRMGRAGFRPMLMPRIRRFDEFADPALLAQQLSFHHGTLRYWVAQDNTFFVIFANMTPIFSVTAWRPTPASE